MPSIQLNAATGIQNTQMMKPKIAVSIPVNNNYDDGDDSSNNGKKSKRSLFNKMQRSSPKLVKSFDEMTTSEKIAFFNSLSDKEKLNLMNQSYKSTLRYVNSLSDEQKAAFLSKLDSAVNKAQNGGATNPSGSDDDSDSGITNIMMILVKAFVNNMNTDALDELQKTFEANLVNQYLQNIQNQMKTQIAKQEKLAAKMSGKSGFWSTGNKVMLGIGIGVAVLGIVGMFFPPAEIFSALFDGIDATASSAEGFASESLGADEEVNLDMLEPDKENVNMTEEELSEEVPSSADSSSSSSSPISNDSTSSPTQKSDVSQPIKETDKIADTESGGTTDNPEAINKVDNTRWGKLKQVPRNNVNKMFENGKGPGVANIVKGVVKSAVAGGATFLGGTTMVSLFGKNGQQNEQNQITDCQSEISSGTSASDILNNNEQQDSKRISDDSQRISQASGYVSQAINMLGSAMSFRV
ncbi:MAG: hypothetical protein K1060chlam4_00426 [Candidatus Anoxychlamydiales bacterium]|nr:hypothetical protein [Candidatus Anoxychlamydiales bacterium]